MGSGLHNMTAALNPDMLVAAGRAADAAFAHGMHVVAALAAGLLVAVAGVAALVLGRDRARAAAAVVPSAA